MFSIPKQLDLLRSKFSHFGKTVIQDLQSFEQVLTKLLSELGEFDVEFSDSESDPGYEYRVSTPASQSFLLHTKTYQRLTPATAEGAFSRMRDHSDRVGAVSVVFASVVSNRTAEIAKAHGVSWIDFAGNCRLVFPEHGIYVHRTGIRNPFGKTMSSKLNVFSPKSSRVVRAMLQEPSRGWQLNELAKHNDVRISNGLMSRIKKSLIEDGYALMHEGQLRLKSPKALLRDWVDHYRKDKPNEFAFYMRGDVEQIENQVAAWCSESNLEYALSRFSAAWRLAPEVRYSVASFLVSTEAVRETSLQIFRDQCGARRVDSGANLVLHLPEDESHFTGRVAEPLQITSPLQTYLDLMAMGGRGEEAATAIYEKYLHKPLSEATQVAASLS